jgi:pyridoxamine 5'-phosphate oxidase
LPGQSLHIADLRKDYSSASGGIDEDNTGNDPIAFFQTWFKEAETAEIPEINTMTLATVDAKSMPHARIVLLKGIDKQGFVFFTNYDSAKGREISANSHAALVFFWKELERQVRIEGFIEKISDEDSDSYFKTRPEGSRIGAWASPQSSIIADRNILDLNYTRYEKEFSNVDIPRPPHWGGYRVVPHHIEFWQGRASRMHDRILFTKTQTGTWDKSRLAP